MIVLGVDPGTERVGWGVLARHAGGVRVIDAGVLRLDVRAPLEDRLAVAYDRLVALGREHGVAVFAVEDVFYARYPRAAIALGHVRGVVLLAARHAGARVAAYPPALVKRTVAGRGAADKQRVARMVEAVLGREFRGALDATDALAVAITHLLAAPWTVGARAGAGASAAGWPLPARGRATTTGSRSRGRRRAGSTRDRRA
ncbi:MAG: crossover junction endodeoxyribonuclease RuvC [Myxococcota bacterium]|nr:crossover junction endodeoxyribonuclease RuvC [Myxococcota bacterium]